MKLHVGTKGRGPAVVLLHGLFGAGNNLGALARTLAEHYTVHSVDLPDHGRSGWLDSADIDAMTGCIVDWMVQQGLASAALVGHSLGGKVAMELALSRPAMVDALLVADIAPVAYPPRHDAVFSALELVAGSACRSREEAADLMSRHLQEQGVIQFLLASLQSSGDGDYRWRFNLEGLRAGYPALCEAPPSAGPYQGRVCFIKGSESDYILEQHREAILSRFPGAQLKIIQGSGHWPHADKPKMFNSLVSRFLDASVS